MVSKTFTIRAGATLKYTMTWTDWLGSLTITSASAVASDTDKITVSAVSADDSIVTYTITGILAGSSDVTITMTASSTEVDKRTVRFTVA